MKYKPAQIKCNTNIISIRHQQWPDYPELKKSHGNIPSTEQKLQLSFSKPSKLHNTVFPRAIQFLKFFLVIYSQHWTAFNEGPANCYLPFSPLVLRCS